MSEYTICSDTELRKLRLRELYTLGRILNLSDSWKKLMAIVPREEAADLPKFTSEHFSLIEQAAQQQKRNAAEIFLSEWATMGKQRPTLGTLLNLLIKAELFRAADYVAEDVLKGKPPERPKSGPAAPVNISDEHIKKLLEEEFYELCTFQLPSKNIDNKHVNPRAMDKRTNNSSLERNMQSTKLVSIKEKRNEEEKKAKVVVAAVQRKPIKVSSSKEVSDLIKFGTEQNLQAVPSRILPLDSISNAKNQEMPSRELPVVLREFEQTNQTRLNREMLSNELPIFVNDRTNLFDTNLTTINNNDQTGQVLLCEITSSELPRCIVELRKNSATYVDDTRRMKNDESVQQNVLSSHELPVMVLEYNK